MPPIDSFSDEMTIDKNIMVLAQLEMLRNASLYFSKMGYVIIGAMIKTTMDTPTIGLDTPLTEHGHIVTHNLLKDDSVAI